MSLLDIFRRPSKNAHHAEPVSSATHLGQNERTDDAIHHRAGDILSLAMASAAELSQRLGSFAHARKSYGDDGVDNILLLSYLKAYFIHLALLRINASHTEGDNALDTYATELENYLRHAYTSEFQTTKALIEETTRLIGIEQDPLPAFAGCPMVPSQADHISADQRLLELLLPAFFDPHVHQSLGIFLQEKLQRFSVRFLSDM